MKDQKPPSANPEEYKLAPGEAALIGEYMQAIRDLEQQKNGALQLIVRMQELEGSWALDVRSPDRLVRVKALPGQEVQK